MRRKGTMSAIFDNGYNPHLGVPWAPGHCAARWSIHLVVQDVVLHRLHGGCLEGATTL
jgi:hypothetical protein